MKKQTLYLSILILPFITMISINEFIRINTTNKGYTKQGVKTINTDQKLKNQCSWACHHDTNYCKENHVKLMASHFDKTDPIYFGIIRALKSTGNYGVANLLILVILLPITMYILLIQSINLQSKIRQLK